MKIVAIAELHGKLPSCENLFGRIPVIPRCDLLLIAGGIAPTFDDNLQQQAWMDETFKPWLAEQPIKKCVATWGHHDWIGEYQYQGQIDCDWLNDYPHDFEMLVDRTTTYEGLTIHGIPWTREFNNWAFNLPEVTLASRFYVAGLSQPDIILSHGPPLGMFDKTVSGERAGCKAFKQLLEQQSPKLAVWGHIHEARGCAYVDRTCYANVSLVDEHYRPVHKPMEFFYDGERITRIGQ